MAGRMYPNLVKPTSYYIGILRIGNYGEHGETIFLARRTRVPRARDSWGLSAHLADNPVRHCGKRVLHAQLEAIPRNAARKQVVWSHARKLGARQEHFAAFEDNGSRDDRREPHHFIRIFQHSAFCDDFRYHRVRRYIGLHPHEAERAADPFLATVLSLCCSCSNRLTDISQLVTFQKRLYYLALKRAFPTPFGSGSRAESDPYPHRCTCGLP